MRCDPGGGGALAGAPASHRHRSETRKARRDTPHPSPAAAAAPLAPPAGPAAPGARRDGRYARLRGVTGSTCRASPLRSRRGGSVGGRDRERGGGRQQRRRGRGGLVGDDGRGAAGGVQGDGHQGLLVLEKGRAHGRHQQRQGVELTRVAFLVRGCRCPWMASPSSATRTSEALKFRPTQNPAPPYPASDPALPRPASRLSPGPSRTGRRHGHRRGRPRQAGQVREAGAEGPQAPQKAPARQPHPLGE